MFAETQLLWRECVRWISEWVNTDPLPSDRGNKKESKRRTRRKGERGKTTVSCSTQQQRVFRVYCRGVCACECVLQSHGVHVWVCTLQSRDKSLFFSFFFPNRNEKHINLVHKTGNDLTRKFRLEKNLHLRIYIFILKFGERERERLISAALWSPSRISWPRRFLCTWLKRFCFLPQNDKIQGDCVIHGDVSLWLNVVFGTSMYWTGSWWKNIDLRGLIEDLTAMRSMASASGLPQLWLNSAFDYWPIIEILSERKFKRNQSWSCRQAKNASTLLWLIGKKADRWGEVTSGNYTTERTLAIIAFTVSHR